VEYRSPDSMVTGIIGSLLMLCLVAVLLGYALVLGPAQDCQRMAAAIHRPYYYHPIDGCWVQTTEGNYQRVDRQALPNYQP
jgi:hypothetical protein